MAKKTFTFDNKSSADFGLFINGRGVFNSPEQDLEYISIPGRSGDLIYDNNRFRNIKIVYPACFMLSGFKSNFASLKSFLLKHKGYYKLKDDYNPDYFRFASIESPIELSEINWVYDSGLFDLRFNCKPQLYKASGYDTGGTTYLPNDTYLIENETDFAAKPLIRVRGAGQFTLDNVTITIASHNYSYIDIDCELMDCYSGSYNCNQYVTIGDRFPELKPGYNSLVIPTGITNLMLFPRYWTV